MQLGTLRPSPHMEPCEIRAGMVGPTIIVIVSGELDVATLPQLLTALAVAEGPRSVVLDLSEVTFVDTRSLRVIVAAHERLRWRGVVLAVRRPSPVVRRLMELLGLAALIEGQGPATSAATATPTNDRWAASNVTGFKSTAVAPTPPETGEGLAASDSHPQLSRRESAMAESRSCHLEEAHGHRTGIGDFEPAA